MSQSLGHRNGVREGRLIGQIERVLKISKKTIVTKEVVETARKNLVIGPT